MPPGKLELSDVSEAKDNSQSSLTANSGSRNGCFVHTVVGVALAALAVVLVIAVALIVHFTADVTRVKCNCGGALSWTNGSATSSALTARCVQLAKNGHKDICSKCSDVTSSPTVTSQPTPPTKPRIDDVRLPSSLKPIHYDLEIWPFMHYDDPKDFHFKGFVRLKLECKTATSKVTLHKQVLQIIESSIRIYGVDPDPTDPSYVRSEEDEPRQFYNIFLNKNMQPGTTYIVEMNFTSPLHDDLKGFYYSSYTRGDDTVYVGVTQFAPTDARKAFPCMDEPALKATFNISLVRQRHLVSLSNMPVAVNSSIRHHDGLEYVVDEYQQSPRMSTYLLAFVFCDFTSAHSQTKRGVQYGAWARPEERSSTRYALDVGTQVLTYFEDYFEINYPLPKQDLIAIPDFAAGAMENWGLIVYRETTMLYDPKKSNLKTKERVASIVSHELAHQWFGDLVTPTWWGDIWLNEGFASFVEYLGVDLVHPDWHVFDKFVIDNMHVVFTFDGLVTSHPLFVPVSLPDEINEIFDSISYRKGASVIRMMRHFLGNETFRLGIVNYLKDRAYDAASHNDLWKALTEQARKDGKNIDVKKVMDTWTLQMNYPLVTVSRDVNDLDVLKVKQERYLRDRSATDSGEYESPFGYTWAIPLTFTSSQGPRFDLTDKDVWWMDRKETEKTFNVGNLPNPGDKDGWYLANVQQNGFYRVNYPTSNWQALATQLKTDHKMIAVTNRAQIINDAWNLAKSGELGLGTALLTLEYLRDETNYIPWFAAKKELSYVRHMLSLTSTNGPFERFLGDMAKSTFEVLRKKNMNGDLSHKEKSTLVLVTELACATGNEDCVQDTSQGFAQWMAKPLTNHIDPDMKSATYCNAIRNGDWEEWNFALQMYLKSTVSSEKSTLLFGMSCTEKPWILNHYLEMLLEKRSAIRRQDLLSVISYISGNVIGRPLAWKFFKSRFDELSQLFGKAFFAWTRAIGSITSFFNTEYELEEMKSFMALKGGSLGTGKRAFEQGIEKTQGNIAWMRTNLPIIKQWLNDNGY